MYFVSFPLFCQARSSRRLHTAARWCWRGDTTSDQLRPIYPMDAHDSARLEEAYIGSIQYGTQNACTYGSDGAIYETNFVLMLQVRFGGGREGIPSRKGEGEIGEVRECMFFCEGEFQPRGEGGGSKVRGRRGGHDQLR